jgi:hypothetical protein
LEVKNMAKPEKRFKCGAIEAAVFVNGIAKNGNTIRMKKVSIQKRHMKADGEWSSTNSYDANDLPKLRVVADEAYRYLTMGQGNGSGDPAEDRRVSE